SNSNIGGVYPLSIATDAIIASARERAGIFLGCHQDDISFGQNATTLNFALTAAFARTLNAGDEIIVTQLDHEANVSPWLIVADDYDLVVKVAGLTDDLQIDLGDLEAKLSNRTRAVAYPYISNAVGTVTPVRAIAEMAHSVDAVAWLDAVA